MTRTDKGSVVPKFKVGDKVRVKPGVNDPDFPDMPLGGWAGTVTEVIVHGGQVNCVFKLDRRTLVGIHPIFKRRSEIDGLDYKSMGLGQEDIELNEGVPIPIEQPKAIVPRSLAMEDQDDRVRMALGLTHDDPLPEVSRKTLLVYYRYLAAHLTLPFKARYESDGTSLTVHRLPDPKEYDLDEEERLLCEARDCEGPFPVPLSEVDDAVGNRKLVRDYGYWFVNYR